MIPAPAQLASRPGSLRSMTCTCQPRPRSSQASERPTAPPPRIRVEGIAVGGGEIDGGTGRRWRRGLDLHLLAGQKPFQQDFVHAAAETDFVLNFDDGHASREAGFELRIVVDIDFDEGKATSGE